MNRSAGGYMPGTLAERLAEYTLSVHFEGLPDLVVCETKRRFIDALGCALGARHAEAPRAAERVASRVQHERGATTLYGSLTSPDMAAFVNGILIRYLDFNDTYLSKEPAHPSDNLAAVLAAGELAGSTGKDLISAAVVAYEVQCRLADAWSIRSQGWDHVCYGAFSTALGAGKLLGLDRPSLVHAQGISGVAHMAMRQTRVGELSMWKGAAFANASRNGVLAAMLAREGLTGPAPIFEGEMGFFTEVAHGEFDLPDLGGRNGAEYMLPSTYIKNWPAEYHAQSAIEAALELRDEIGGPAAVDHVLIESFKAAVEIIADAEKWHPKTRETADHSLPYCVAVALQDGRVGLDQFSEQRMADPMLLDLLSRIEVREEASLNERYPASTPNRITVTMRNGHSVAREIEFPRGHSGNPMTDDEVEDKFRRMASGEMSPQRQVEVLRRLWELEAESDLRSLLALFGPNE
jgi:2-methylcitrate dehydratase